MKGYCGLLGRGRHCAAIITAALLLTSAPVVAQDATLVVNMTGFRNSNGQAAVAVFNAQEGFPSDAAKAVRKQLVRIENGRAIATFNDVPPGSYAVSVLHDENGNGVMDKSLLGKPREGYGVSNNAKARSFSAPSFESATFSLQAPGRDLIIEIRY
jgi:uncharacterized protein (DUF2141 family)